MTSKRRKAEKRGRRAERWAALYLRLKGYRILKTRHRTPMGEVDLIARKGRTLAFVEVKARSDLVSGLDAISRHQQRRSVRAALAFVMHKPELAALDLRFDALIIRPFRLPVHVESAWQAEQRDLP